MADETAGNRSRSVERSSLMISGEWGISSDRTFRAISGGFSTVKPMPPPVFDANVVQVSCGCHKRKVDAPDAMLSRWQPRARQGVGGLGEGVSPREQTPWRE
jgi:hypothetical protein